MSFVYPRRIRITRPTQPVGKGAVAYGAQLAATEIQVANNVQCSIQQKRDGQASSVKLPGDAKTTYWRCLIPVRELKDGTVSTWDIVTDDQGSRYQVQAPYWNSLGYNLLLERLEV